MIRGWLRSRRQRREALQLLDELFGDAERLRNSSLRPEHRSRLDLHTIQTDSVSGAITDVFFVIVRHPRPYAFSKQRHEVAELYRWERSTDTITVDASVNLTRKRGQDSDGWGMPG